MNLKECCPSFSTIHPQVRSTGNSNEVNLRDCVRARVEGACVTKNGEGGLLRGALLVRLLAGRWGCQAFPGQPGSQLLF